ncbi:MAG: Dolichyl-phosphate-mannose-protein mannosyltransferase [Gaiellales bacterium]|jgi:4-amino-4-deoxy-L-arabinose transferase-like glycosyltransferase|nr:Dolichyl-phosphate-mannose-protein mannosyltransferase [Gaiellales bacterium]
MAAAVETPRERRRLALAVGLLSAAYLATRVALTWRFPLYVDETTFASFARDVHGDIGQFFAAEIDKKGLLPSWLGAGLIGAGIDPVTAMRLLAAAGAALAAVCGGLFMRRLYGLREGLLTAALIALGPYFLVNASVGIYDAMVTGLVAAAVLVSIRLVQRPRPATAVLLGLCIGAGGLTKPTAAVAVVVLPFTLVLFDYASPERRRRLLVWAGYAALAVVLGYAITSIARLTPLYDQPMVPKENHRGLGQVFDDIGPRLRANGPLQWNAITGYLTTPGLLLAAIGVIAGLRRQRAATAILAVWTLSVLASALLLALWPYPRYFAAAIVPLSAFVVLGGVAVWDALVDGSWMRRSWRIAVAAVVVLVSLTPALRYEGQVLADPVNTAYPGADLEGYVWAISAQTWVAPFAREIERRGGPYPVHVDVVRGYTWGLDLRLNGAAVGSERHFDVFSGGTPARRASARYLVSDGAHGDAPPRPGYHLVMRKARILEGAVARLYERS